MNEIQAADNQAFQTYQFKSIIPLIQHVTYSGLDQTRSRHVSIISTNLFISLSLTLSLSLSLSL